jgi:hypothetical protein
MRKLLSVAAAAACVSLLSITSAMAGGYGGGSYGGGSYAKAHASTSGGAEATSYGGFSVSDVDSGSYALGQTGCTCEGGQEAYTETGGFANSFSKAYGNSFGGSGANYESNAEAHDSGNRWGGWSR